MEIIDIKIRIIKYQKIGLNIRNDIKNRIAV
jgi:hypothetical protein